MAEWSIAPVLKTDVPRGTGGSNPSLSAKREADRNSNLFEGLSAFSFCKDARGSARDGQRDQRQILRDLRNQAYNFANLKRKKSLSFTPLNCALNAFIFALNDSDAALVERLSKKLSIFS